MHPAGKELRKEAGLPGKGHQSGSRPLFCVVFIQSIIKYYGILSVFLLVG